MHRVRYIQPMADDILSRLTAALSNVKITSKGIHHSTLLIPRLDDRVILANSKLETFATHLNTHKLRNIIVLSGAGISTAAGIPDFRSPGSGLYDNLSKYNLPYAEAIFTLDYFEARPMSFG
jgi:hypothetical protein